jgi:hypothetical protein
LLPIPLKRSSRTIIFVPTSSQRIHLTKSNDLIDKLDDDSEDIYCKNMLDRYSSRSNNLSNTCLAEFSANYVPVYRNQSPDSDIQPDILQSETPPLHNKHITLLNNMGNMARSKAKKVL